MNGYIIIYQRDRRGPWRLDTLVVGKPIYPDESTAQAEARQANKDYGGMGYEYRVATITDLPE